MLILGSILLSNLIFPPPLLFPSLHHSIKGSGFIPPHVSLASISPALFPSLISISVHIFPCLLLRPFLFLIPSFQFLPFPLSCMNIFSPLFSSFFSLPFFPPSIIKSVILVRSNLFPSLYTPSSVSLPFNSKPYSYTCFVWHQLLQLLPPPPQCSLPPFTYYPHSPLQLFFPFYNTPGSPPPSIHPPLLHVPYSLALTMHLSTPGLGFLLPSSFHSAKTHPYTIKK